MSNAATGVSASFAAFLECAPRHAAAWMNRETLVRPIRDELIAKPFTVEDLAIKVGQVLDKPRVEE